MARPKLPESKRPLFRPRQLLLLAYLLTIVLWLVRGLVGSAVMINYKLKGEMPQQTVAPAELVTESFAPYSSNQWWTPPDDDPNWYLSTDSDPHIYWQGQGYLETVRLYAEHQLPPGGVALYYLLPARPIIPKPRKSMPMLPERGSIPLIWGDAGSPDCASTRTVWAAFPPCSMALN